MNFGPPLRRHRAANDARNAVLAVAVGMLLLAAPCRADEFGRTFPSLRGDYQPGTFAILASSQDNGPSDQPTKGGEDLTALSLEQLLQLDITTVNVLGGHTHLEGEWMVAYRYMVMSMEGYRSGTSSVSNARVLKRFPTIHTRMTMVTQMLEVMHAPSDRVTVTVMFPYHRNQMKHLRSNGTRFKTRTRGLGDITAMVIHTVAGNPHEMGTRLLINGGVSFPSGSINKRTSTGGKQEYAMQLGSGTVDLMPGITYLGNSKDWSWGSQVLGIIRLGTNSNGYKFGDEVRLSVWGVRRVTDWFAPSARLDGRWLGSIHGRDREINPLGNPESNPLLHGGERLDLFVGVNFYAPRGSLEGTRLTIEGGLPIYQKLNGPQIETDWQIIVTASRTFK